MTIVTVSEQGISFSAMMIAAPFAAGIWTMNQSLEGGFSDMGPHFRA